MEVAVDKAKGEDEDEDGEGIAAVELTKALPGAADRTVKSSR